MTNSIKYKKEVIPLDLLKPNFIHEKLKFSVDEYYAKEAARFNFYQCPVVTDDNVVLSNYNEVLAARANKIKEIEVIRVTGLEKDNWLRFISHDAFFKNLDYPERYALIIELQAYLKENKRGIEWANELEGDINEKIARVINYHKESVKLLKRIGSKDPRILEMKGTLEQMLAAVNLLNELPGPAIEPPEPLTNDKISSLQGLNVQFTGRGLELSLKDKSLKLFMMDPVIRGNSVSFRFRTMDSECKGKLTLNNPLHLLNQSKG